MEKKKVHYDSATGIIDNVPLFEINNALIKSPYFEVSDDEWVKYFSVSPTYTVFVYKDGKISTIPDPDHLSEYADDRKKEEISNYHYILASTDYVIAKLQEISLTGTADELSEAKAKYADVIAKRKEAREKLAQLEG